MKAKREAMAVAGEVSGAKPYLMPLAFTLLEEIREYFRRPESEAEFEAWLREHPEIVRQEAEGA